MYVDLLIIVDEMLGGLARIQNMWIQSFYFGICSLPGWFYWYWQNLIERYTEISSFYMLKDITHGHVLIWWTHMYRPHTYSILCSMPFFPHHCAHHMSCLDCLLGPVSIQMRNGSGSWALYWTFGRTSASSGPPVSQNILVWKPSFLMFSHTCTFSCTLSFTVSKQTRRHLCKIPW